MPEILVLRLDAAEPSRGEWIVVDGDGRRLAAPASGPLADALPFAAGRKLVVLAPASDVLLLEVELPVRGAAKIQKALPFALEEQIAQDVEAMHFAAGRASEGPVLAAAVERERIEEWLAQLREAGLEPQVICSEAEGTPAIPNHLCWLIDDERFFVRAGDGVPVVLEPRTVDEALRFGPGFPDDGESTRLLAVWLTPAAQARLGAALEGLRERFTGVEIRLLDGGALAHLAGGVATREPVNLLQGSFAPRTNVEKLWKPWRVAAALLAALLLVMVAQDALRLVRLKGEEARLEAAIREAFEQALPGARMEEPRVQVERALAAVRGTGAAANEGFLEALDVLGGALAAAPGAQLQAINFRAGTLDLQLQAPSVDVLESIRQAVSRGGRFSATIQQANPSSDGVEGRIQLAPAAGA